MDSLVLSRPQSRPQSLTRAVYRPARNLLLRLAGLGLLAAFWRIATVLRNLVAAQPAHQASPAQFALAAAAFLLLTGGLGLLLEGAGINRQVPIPKQSAFFPYR